VAIVFWCLAMTPRPASAAFIGLTAPVTGTNNSGDLIGLTVSFDPSGSAAANVVSMDLYVAFTGDTGEQERDAKNSRSGSRRRRARLRPRGARLPIIRS
jgi:hypothetical protein